MSYQIKNLQTCPNGQQYPSDTHNFQKNNYKNSAKTTNKITSNSTYKHVTHLNFYIYVHFRDGVTFVTFTCEPKKFLPFLMDKFLENGGNLRKMKITDFRDLEDFDCIVNCAGLNAQELTQDTLLQPIRGQISRVK